MAKNKAEEMKVEAAEVAAKEDPQEVQAVDMKALEEAALAKVLKKLGISEQDVDDIARGRAEAEDMLDYDLGGQIVYINGIPYSKGTAPRNVVETVLAMAANRKDRLLNEMVGKKGMANLVNGQIRADIPVTEREDALGQKVSQ